MAALENPAAPAAAGSNARPKFRKPRRAISSRYTQLLLTPPWPPRHGPLHRPPPLITTTAGTPTRPHHHPAVSVELNAFKDSPAYAELLRFVKLCSDAGSMPHLHAMHNSPSHRYEHEHGRHHHRRHTHLPTHANAVRGRTISDDTVHVSEAALKVSRAPPTAEHCGAPAPCINTPPLPWSITALFARCSREHLPC